MKIPSRGHVLRQVVHPGEPGDTVVILDEKGQEIGRGVGVPTGNIMASFDPALQLPARGFSYEVYVIPARGARESGAEGR